METVSLCCDFDDDDCVINDNDITGGNWLIGEWTFRGADIIDDVGVGTVEPAGDQWPHQVSSWEFYTGNEWAYDPKLTVTGNL